MRLEYIAYDRSGRKVADALEAASPAEAGEQLRRQGLFVVQIAERGAAPILKRRVRGQSPSRPKLGIARDGRTARLRNVTAFFRQLSVLVATGTPVVEALAAIERQAPEGRWRETLGDLRSRVEEGAGFAESMAEHPRYFDAVGRSLVAAGESSGQLEEMLTRLAALSRQQLKVRSSITGAMAYPCLLLVVCIAVLCVMIGFVLPRFEGLFETLGAPLPPTTKLLMDLSAFMRSYWWGVLIALGLAGFGVWSWLNSASGRAWWHGVVLRLPIFGRVVKSFAIARIVRVLGVLLEGRVPLMDALQLTRQSTGNLHFASLVSSAEDEVTRGGSISNALAASDLISQSVTEAVRSGEKTGQIGPVMTNLAEFMDEDNEVILRSISSLVEPVILIVLGLLVGFVAVSMFLPLFDLATTSQTGGNA